MARNFVYDVKINQPVDRVWQALTDREQLGAWLMSNDFSPAVGHKFQFKTSAAAGSDGVVNCEVLEVAPKTRLAYRWVGGPMMNTTLSFELAPDGAGTHLKVTHAGFEMLKWGFVSLFLGSRWKKLDRAYLDALQQLMNKGPARG
jgi:uncharacterized protein YndB with AHSA1/START domain